MVRPKFRLSYLEPHYSLGIRYYAIPLNKEADKLIKDRDNGVIPDFALVCYTNKFL
jgi:hypothetical protein